MKSTTYLCQHPEPHWQEKQSLTMTTESSTFVGSNWTNMFSTNSNNLSNSTPLLNYAQKINKHQPLFTSTSYAVSSNLINDGRTAFFNGITSKSAISHLNNEQLKNYQINLNSSPLFQQQIESLSLAPKTISNEIYDVELMQTSNFITNSNTFSSATLTQTQYNGPANQQQQQKNPKLYKTELCRSWTDTGRCNYGERCQYAHGESEKRPIPRHPKYKTEACQSYHKTGYCPYGPRCHFIHNEEPHVIANLVAANNVSKATINETSLTTSNNMVNSTISVSSSNILQSKNSIINNLKTGSISDSVTPPATPICISTTQSFGSNENIKILNSSPSSAEIKTYRQRQFVANYDDNNLYGVTSSENDEKNNVKKKMYAVTDCLNNCQNQLNLLEVTIPASTFFVENSQNQVCLQHNLVNSNCTDEYRKKLAKPQSYLNQCLLSLNNSKNNSKPISILNTNSIHDFSLTSYCKQKKTDENSDLAPSASLASADSGTESPELGSDLSELESGFSPNFDADKTNIKKCNVLNNFSTSRYQNLIKINEKKYLHARMNEQKQEKNFVNDNLTNISTSELYLSKEKKDITALVCNLSKNLTLKNENFECFKSNFDNKVSFALNSSIPTQDVKTRSSTLLLQNSQNLSNLGKKIKKSEIVKNIKIVETSKAKNKGKKTLKNDNEIDSVRRYSGSSLGSTGVACVTTPTSSSSASVSSDELWAASNANEISLNQQPVDPTIRLPVFEQLSNGSF